MQRDYFKDPLKYGEKIPYDDLYEVYIEKNRPKNELPQWFNCTKDKVKSSMKFYGLQKSMELRNKCAKMIMMEKYGVENIFEKKEFIKQKTMEKYGVDNVKKLDWVNEKSKQTCIERYGVTHPNKHKKNRDKITKTNQERYGGNAPMCSREIKEKTRKTNLERYGGTTPLKNDKIKKKMLDTRTQKYGSTSTYDAPGAREKYQQTCQEKYGKDFLTQSEKVKEKCKETCSERYGVEYSLQAESVKEKARETLLKRYGVDHIMKLPETIQKVRETAKKNESYKGKSKAEKYIYDKLITKFPQTDWQHYEERYPFNCDFYVPEIDTFIEYQGYRSHGDYPFDPNNPDHLKQVKFWEEKSHEINLKGKPKNQYMEFISVWTISDPLKRQTAKDNNLNWIEFFSLEEFEEWFKNI